MQKQWQRLLFFRFCAVLVLGLWLTCAGETGEKRKKDERIVDGKAHRTQTKGGVKWKRKKLSRRYKQGHTRSNMSRIVVARLTGTWLARS